MGGLCRLVLLTCLFGLSNKKSSMRRKLPELNGYEPPPAWEPPSIADCDPEEILPTTLDQVTRITQRFRRYHGRIVDFAIVLEAQGPDGEWVEVSKVDCCHAQVHLHQRVVSGDVDDTRVVLREVNSETDIQDSVNTAIDLVFENYEEYLRRWSNGR